MQMPTSSTVWCAPVSRSPFALDRQVEAAVAREQVEHVVEEADAGARARRAPSPSSCELDVDLGLAGLAVDLAGTRHRVPLSRMRASIDRAWSSKPSARATGAACASELRGALLDPHLGEPAPEVPGRQRRREASGAVGRQDVVGAGDVVAERGPAGGADEHAAGAS